MLVHLRSVMKLMARRGRSGEGFVLGVIQDGTTILEGDWTGVGTDDVERVRKTLTQVCPPPFRS